MKIILIYSLVFCAAISIGYAQSDESRLVFWDSVGQRVTITYGERYNFFWRDANPDSCIIRYIPIFSSEKYILEVIKAPITNKIVKIARAIYTEKKSNLSFIKDIEWTEPDTTLYWHYGGQKHCVPFGKRVNFYYSRPDLKKYYITYELSETGYCINLTSNYEITRLHFKARCQKFIVPDPSYVSITYDDAVKYEQIIWTPLLNGNWEVRMGTVEQGCISDAFDQIGDMQSKTDYLKTLNIDKSNFDAKFKKKRSKDYK